MVGLALAVTGRRVGDFVIGRQIGQGGMGATYLAEQVTLHRVVVVKVIAADRVSEDHKVRFLREARLASRLDHPYAAHVYAFGAEADGLLWIAMEQVRGMPLDTMLAEQGPLPLARFVPLFDRLCEVVYSAHEQGIIHRDIKPANVMVVRRAGRMLPKLLDLGIARSVAANEPRPDVSIAASLAMSSSSSSSSSSSASAATEHTAAGGAQTGAEVGWGSSAAGDLTDLSELAVDSHGRSITIVGGLTGSPAYMAPEQWVDATRADARTDQYALAVTAYELLTGTRPFTGATVVAIARAHARGKQPPLGHGLPAALDHVLARALARRADDRYASVLELAAAIRDAARDAEAFSATDLDEVVRDAFVAGGPQPLAEALAALAAARAPDAAWTTVWRVVDVLVRMLGAIALAARARSGDRARDDEAARLVRTLVEHGLDAAQWAELVEALVKPAAERPQAYPVPELVALCFDELVPRRAFDELFALRRTASGDEPVGAELAQQALALLGKALRACAFVADYGWVVAAASGGESWTGPRRDPRGSRAVPPSAARDSVWLVDADGTAVLELSPIVSVAPPSPGSDPEAFIVDGPAKRGARAVAWPREFERHDDVLWQFIDQHVAPLGDRAAAAEREDRAPYRGLATFAPGDASMFYGREREVEAVVNRLRVQPLIAVVGPSGVGKSSFVQAGVIPALPESWQTLTLRPGAAPLAAIENRLVAAGVAATGLAERLRDSPGALRQVVEAAASQLGARLVLVIDQLEEMFTQCRDAAVRAAFGEALATAAHGPDSPVRIVLTLRDDFLVRGAELAGLGERLATGLELLTLPDPESLRRILVLPLELVGYTFEDAALPEAMVAAVRDHPGALALLSFAAAKLWELRDRRFRHIPSKAYDAIGGVAGALARHAEDTLAALPIDDRAMVRELFRHLVTSEGTRAVLHRDEALELLGKTAAAEHVIEALVERRLLVGSEGADGGRERIEVIHEALLSAWPRLVGWQREDADGARLRDQLRTAARQWAERGRDKGLLWRGEALVEYRLWRARQPGALTEIERAFADASNADEARTRRRRRIAMITAITGLVIAIVVLQRANGIARHNALVSRRTALALLAEQGRSALVTDRPQDALVYLSAAYTAGAEEPNLPFLLGATVRELGGELAVLRGHTAGVVEVKYTADGAHAVTASYDHTVKVWSAATGALERTFAGTTPGGVRELALGPHDALITVGPDEPPTAWNLVTGARAFTLTAAGKGGEVAYTADGSVIATLGNGALRTWNATDGSARDQVAIADLEYPEVHGHWLAAVAADGGVLFDLLDLHAPPARFPMGQRPRLVDVSADGQRVAIVLEDSRVATVWDVAHPGVSHELGGHAGDVLLTAFSPDGSKLLTTSLDHTAKVWDASTGRLLVSLNGHGGYLLPGVWSPDGEIVATGSVDRTARLWDVRSGAQRAVFYGNTDFVFRLAFDPSGRHLLTGSLDNSARIYDTAPAGTERTLRHAGGTVSLRFSTGSGRLLAVNQDDIAWIYDPVRGTEVAKVDDYAIPRNPDRVDSLDLRLCGDISPDGETIVLPTGTDARIIRLADRAHPTILGPHPARVTCARFAPGGKVITGDAEGAIAIWGADGKLVHRFAAGDGAIKDIAIDPASGRFITGAAGARALPRLYEADGTPTAHPIALERSGIPGVAISHDGKRCASAGQDTVARVFDVATGAQQTASHSLSDLEAIAFSPDDRRIAAANTDGTVTLYDSVDGRLLMHYGDGDTTGWSTGIDLSADGKLLAVGDNSGRIRVWTVSDETRSAHEVAEQVRCHVPLALVDTRLVARPNADPDCR